MQSFLIVWLLWAQLNCQQIAETCYVVHVKGEVINQSTQRVLKLQDRLELDDALDFKTPESEVALYIKGRYFVINEAYPAYLKESGRSSRISELLDVVKNRALQKQKSRSDSLRGVNSLEDFFGIPTFVFLGNSYGIKINPGSFPMNSGKYFVYTYAYGGNVVKKRISSSGNTLIFNKDELYTEGGNLIEPEKAGKVDIYYYDGTRGTPSQKIMTFLPVFVPEEELKAELQLMLNIATEEELLDEEEKLDKLYKHVEIVYGNTNKERFDEWVKSNIDIGVAAGNR